MCSWELIDWVNKAWLGFCCNTRAFVDMPTYYCVWIPTLHEGWLVCCYAVVCVYETPVFGNFIRQPVRQKSLNHPTSFKRSIAPERRGRKQMAYLNSARIGDHPDITFYCQKRVFRETKHFSSSFSMWYFSIFSTETGWKFPTYLWGLITEEKSEIRQKLTKIWRLFTKCIYNFGTYFRSRQSFLAILVMTSLGPIL